MSSIGIELIAKERQRQIEKEGWTSDHDDKHTEGQLSIAASLYSMPPLNRDLTPWGVPWGWPWEFKWWKPTPDDRIKELVKAGALIAAEIDRLIRERDAKSQD